MLCFTEAEKQQQVAKITWQQNIEEKEAQKTISGIEGKQLVPLKLRPVDFHTEATAVQYTFYMRQICHQNQPVLFSI